MDVVEEFVSKLEHLTEHPEEFMPGAMVPISSAVDSLTHALLNIESTKAISTDWQGA